MFREFRNSDLLGFFVWAACECQRCRERGR